MKKHGRYDEQRHLPDNTGEPRGNGSRTWLLETVTQHWPELADAARRQRGDRYTWLIVQLKTMQDERASSIIEEYRTRINADQQRRAQRDRKRRLAQFESLAQLSGAEQPPYISQRIAKLRQQIANTEQKARPS